MEPITVQSLLSEEARLLGERRSKLFSDPHTETQLARVGLDEGRFDNLAKNLAKRGARNPNALAAFIGRKKYGNKKFQQMAAAGRRHEDLLDLVAMDDILEGQSMDETFGSALKHIGHKVASSFHKKPKAAPPPSHKPPHQKPRSMVWARSASHSDHTR